MGLKTLNDYSYFSIEDILSASEIIKLPYSVRILLENMIRVHNFNLGTQDDIKNVASWTPGLISQKEIPFLPSRVVLQDFTGVPAVVDLATMRDAAKNLGFSPQRVNPLVRSDLVIDHSIQVDFYKTSEALQKNTEIEFINCMPIHDRFKL